MLTIENSIGSARGAFGIGGDYQDAIYHSNTIGSSPFGGEKNMPMLTNAWGEDGNWNTTLGPDGLYQVSVMIWDEEGNGASKSDYVYVNNQNQTITELNLPADIYARDYIGDTGAVPSNLAGETVCRTPDIVIVDAGTPPPASNNSPGNVSILETGKSYPDDQSYTLTFSEYINGDYLGSVSIVFQNNTPGIE